MLVDECMGGKGGRLDTTAVEDLWGLKLWDNKANLVIYWWGIIIICKLYVNIVHVFYWITIVYIIDLLTFIKDKWTTIQYE